MRFCIVTQVVHKFHDGNYYGYTPYIREMDIWNNCADEVIIIAPLISARPNPIETPYSFRNIKFVQVPEFNIVSGYAIFQTFWKVPYIMILLFWTMLKSDHIHLRCPGNMGLLGSFVQILLPRKKKTAKYAGNWDWQTKQPLTYRIQQRILRNTILARKMQVLVYGDWKETSNIKPFFTASYSDKDIFETPARSISRESNIKLLFVGGLNPGKRPMLSLSAAKQLTDQGVACEIHFYGEGTERGSMEEFILKNKMESFAFLHGNVSSDRVADCYRKSHFLIFLSKSEGWPKVVAESMFWGCLPLTNAVSCVPEMIGYGLRGDIVEPDIQEIVKKIKYYLQNPLEYSDKCQNAMDWSREYTIEKLEQEIKILMS